MKENPFIIVQKVYYNPEYGDDRVCECGHSYYKHFDRYSEMEFCGCKHRGHLCDCEGFREHEAKGSGQLIDEANNRLLLETARRLLLDAQESVANNHWLRNRMDLKINNFLASEYFTD